MMVIKDVDVPLLSDKDGDGEDLLNKQVQIKISPQKIDRSLCSLKNLKKKF